MSSCFGPGVVYQVPDLTDGMVILVVNYALPSELIHSWGIRGQILESRAGLPISCGLARTPARCGSSQRGGRRGSMGAGTRLRGQCPVPHGLHIAECYRRGIPFFWSTRRADSFATREFSRLADLDLQVQSAYS